MQILDDIQGLGLKDLFDTYAFINQQKINQGVSKSANLIAELNAQTELAKARINSSLTGLTTATKNNKLLVVGVLLGVGFVAYKLLK